MSNHTDTTTEWYVRWLEESRPDLTPEQRVEIATGFVALQQPPGNPRDTEDDDIVMPTGESVGEARAAARKQERLHKFIDDLLKESEGG